MTISTPNYIPFAILVAIASAKARLASLERAYENILTEFREAKAKGECVDMIVRKQNNTMRRIRAAKIQVDKAKIGSLADHEVVLVRYTDSGQAIEREMFLHEALYETNSYPYVKPGMSLRELLSVCDDGESSAYSAQKYWEDKKAEEEQERFLLAESMASSILKEHNNNVDPEERISFQSIDFIRLIQDRINKAESMQEHHEGYENQAEQLAESRFGVVSMEDHYSDMEFTSHRLSASVEAEKDILSWFATECPLTWAKYQESLM